MCCFVLPGTTQLLGRYKENHVLFHVARDDAVARQLQGEREASAEASEDLHGETEGYEETTQTLSQASTADQTTWLPRWVRG